MNVPFGAQGSKLTSQEALFLQVDSCCNLPRLVRSRSNQQNLGLMHHRLHQRLRKGLSLAEELQQFAGRATSMTSAMRRRSLAALIAALPGRKDQLFQQGPAGQLASFLPKVEEATWRLVYASAPHC